MNLLDTDILMPEIEKKDRVVIIQKKEILSD
jgi:hypothetical protein